jgi:hypothetical protein
MQRIPRVFADFQNADSDGRLRFNTAGAERDIRASRLELEVGMILELTDGELTATGVVEAPGPEGVWRLKIDWEKIDSA